MTRTAPPALLVLLAACGAVAPRTPEEACHAEARATPAYREAEQRVTPAVDNPNARAEDLALVAQVERRAFQQCMRLRGLSPPGAGVEPRRPF